MGRSPYPRYGHRIAPVLLADFLDQALPREFQTPGRPPVRLRDLDAGAWERFPRAACHQFGDLVTAALQGLLAVTNSPLRALRLPAIPAPLPIPALELEVRTRNCLRCAAPDGDVAMFSGVTIAQVMEMPHFGGHSLVDFLTALETWLGNHAAPGACGATPAPSGPATRAQLGAGTLQEELVALTTAIPDPRNRRIIARLLDPRLPRRYAVVSVAREFGLTDKRVRQIMDDVQGYLHRLVETPLLDAALQRAAAAVPQLVTDAEAALQAESGSTEPVSIDALLCAARFLNRPPRFAILGGGAQRYIVSQEAAGLVSAVLWFARRLVIHIGVTRVQDVYRKVRRRHAATRIDTVREVLRIDADVVWLDKSQGWFYLRSICRNPLANQIRKALAVAGAIHAADLREGLIRHRPFHDTLPNPLILQEFCRTLEWCQVDAGRVLLRHSLPIEKVLALPELLFHSILTQQGPTLHRDVLQAICDRRGLNRSTFYRYVNETPIICDHPGGYVSLRKSADGAATAVAPLPGQPAPQQ